MQNHQMGMGSVHKTTDFNRTHDVQAPFFASKRPTVAIVVESNRKLAQSLLKQHSIWLTFVDVWRVERNPVAVLARMLFDPRRHGSLNRML
jgi:hypothetical protein